MVRDVGFVGDESGTFYAFDASNGTIMWTTYVGYYISTCADLPRGYFGVTGSAVFNRTLNTVYVMGGNGTFYALSMKTGAVIWSLPVYNSMVLTNYGALLLVNGMIYAPLASRCDFFNYKGQVMVISVAQRKVVTQFFPSGTSYGGGVWGLGMLFYSH